MSGGRLVEIVIPKQLKVNSLKGLLCRYSAGVAEPES